MKFLRYLVGFPLAVIITSALFLLMYHLIREDGSTVPEVVEEVGSIFTRKDPPKPTPPEPVDPKPDLPDPPEAKTTDDGFKPKTPDLPPEGPGVGDLPTGPGGGLGGGEIVIETNGFYPVLTVAPLYPAACETRGVEGSATVEFDVTNAGAVVNARVVEATDSCFERAALKAIEGWKYAPLASGNPDEVRRAGLRKTFVFEFEDE